VVAAPDSRIALNSAFRYQPARQLSQGDDAMADHTPAGPLETGAAMDYSEHDKTYGMFLGLAKWGSLVVAAILIAMAFGFFTSAGFFSSLVLFVLICIVGAFVIR
jgi:hypothetical protein